MKKFLFILMVLVCAAIITAARGEDIKMTRVRIFVVDAEMMHLIPIDTYIKDETAEKQAKRVISTLIHGYDDNPKIRRLIPDIRGCMSVKVNDRVAAVNITDKMIKNHPEGRDLEKLTVYSIVNSLTEIKGIDSVRFTINGKYEKYFMGYLDMTKTFKFENVV